MRELNLSEQYALIALEGQESLHRSVAKSAVLRAVTAAEVLMPVLEKEGCSLSEFTNYNILFIKTQIFNIVIADFYIFAPF